MTTRAPSKPTTSFLSRAIGSALVLGGAFATVPASAAPAEHPRQCRVAEHGACTPLSLTHTLPATHSDDPQILFLNFDSVTLSVGDDDAPNDTTLWRDLAGEWIGHPEWTPALREEARERVATIFAPFDVLVTTTRPKSGDYTMVVVGSHGDFSGGYSTSDCDNLNPNTIAFVAALPEAQSDYNLIAHEAGHSFGLTHTDTQADEIMNPVVWDGSELGTECAPRSSDYCDAILQQHCPVGEQNSHATLCGTLGPWDADEGCPLDADPQPDPDTGGEDSGGGSETDDGFDDGADSGGPAADTSGPAGDDADGGGDRGDRGDRGEDDADDDALPGGTGDGTGDGDGSADDDESGCSCTAGPPNGPTWFAALAIIAFSRRRRQRPGAVW